jgi:hypothetical protein
MRLLCNAVSTHETDSAFAYVHSSRNLIILSRFRVTAVGVWLVTGFIRYLQLASTINSSAIDSLHILQLTTART